MDEMALKVQVYEEERRRLQGVEKAEKQVIEQLTQRLREKTQRVKDLEERIKGFMGERSQVKEEAQEMVREIREQCEERLAVMEAENRQKGEDIR